MGSISKLKRGVIEQLLTLEDFILVLILPTTEGVKLPDDLMKAGEPVGINIGFKMAIPIPDLKIDDGGISGTLSFNRTPFPCVFPWRAIVQVSADLEHMIWVEPLPEDEADVGPETSKQEPPPPAPPRLKLV